MKRLGVLVVAAISLATSVHPVQAQDFRVDLFTKTGVKEVLISPGIAAVEVCGSPTRGPCVNGSPGKTVRCVAEAGAVRCQGDTPWRTTRRVVARSSSMFRLDVSPQEPGRTGTPRGVIVRSAGIRADGERLRAVAAIDLEAYVAGVLAGEVATFKSPAAMEAMAVVARTWALASRGRHRTDGYDFCSLTHCQFFRPPLAPDGNVAVAEAASRTAGLVLKFHGKLIDVYYSAHCGGRTASAASVWPDRAAPYLESVFDAYCAGAGQRAWEQRIPWDEITRVLKNDVIPGFRGPARDLLVGQKDASGRVLTLRLVGDSAQTIDANDFRYALNRRLGWNTLKSNLYTIHPGESGLVFRGRGLGHGVGLCQNGAEQMGHMGAGFESILAHYFPGTTVARAEEDPQRVLSSEHFELFFPAGEEPLVSKALEVLEIERAALGTHARQIPRRVQVRTYASAREFIRVTGQRRWVSGSSDGRAIDLQPLSALESKGILRSTLRHELLHLVVHRLRARSVPTWYEEGMILYLTGEKVTAPPAMPVEPSLSSARAKMERSYALARERVAELARRRGENALWEVLQHPSAEDLKWFNDLR